MYLAAGVAWSEARVTAIELAALLNRHFAIRVEAHVAASWKERLIALGAKAEAHLETVRLAAA